MRVNANTYTQIVQCVNECTANYCASALYDASTYSASEQAQLAEQLQQRDEDVAYINNALAQFARTRNVDKLMQHISALDTFVRDYYADVIYNYNNEEWD